MNEKTVRGRIIGFRKVLESEDDGTRVRAIVLEVESEPMSDEMLWAFVAAQPEVRISFIDDREKDR